MCVNMPKTIKQERLRWVLPIYNKEIRLVDAAKVCPHSQRSLERWLAEYRKRGEKGLEPKSTRPKTSPEQTPDWIKEQIIELRKRTRLCAIKLSWKLEKQGIIVHSRTIGKIIKKQGLTRKYRTRKIKYKYVKIPLKPGELVEIDIKYVPGRIKGRRYYQFTAIDCASRWRYLRVYDDKSTTSALMFFRELLNRVPFKIVAIKTDNDVCFTNRYIGYSQSADPLNPKLHALDVLCQKLGIIHYLIDPGKPAQNGKVERSHRSDQQAFYDRETFKSRKELEQKIMLWNMKYNNLEHCGLNGKTPNEVLQNYSLINVGLKPTNVCG